jgi:hypothetical protein
MEGVVARSNNPLHGSCMDCGVDTLARGEYYALKDSVWRTINLLVIGYMFLACAEDRLGQGLCRGDFSSAPINKTSALKCPALAERLQRAQSSASRGTSRGNVTSQTADIESISDASRERQKHRIHSAV